MKNELFQMWFCVTMLALRDLAIAGQHGELWRAMVSFGFAAFAACKSVTWYRAAEGGKG